jgi:Do/DeqQ family serine protease
MKRYSSIILASMVGAALSLGAYVMFFEQPVEINQYDSPSFGEFTKTVPVIDGSPVDFTTAAEYSVHAVVHVTASTESREYEARNPWDEFFWGQSAPRRYRIPPSVSTGSGVIISNDGYIVTNNHVVEEAADLEVTLNDNRRYHARLIGTDPATDIALIKINENELPFIEFANSDDVRVGEWVLAVGNPFNLNSTVTAGIVSAKGRNINVINDRFAIESFIQTDAAVNPGNSGGALVNTIGQLIGINTAISTHTGSFEGYSFAVPSNIVLKVVNDLMEFGDVQRAFIGVNIRDMNAALAAELDLEEVRGVYVAGLSENGAAADAGLEVGDIIIEVDGTPVYKTSELQEQIGKHRPGDEVEVVVSREGKKKKFAIVLRNRNGSTQLANQKEEILVQGLGAEFEPLSQEELAELGLKNGVRIKKLDDGKLKREGLKEGYVITEITIENETMRIKRPKDITDFLEGRNDVGIFMKGIYPNSGVRYYAFGM